MKVSITVTDKDPYKISKVDSELNYAIFDEQLLHRVQAVVNGLSSLLPDATVNWFYEESEDKKLQIHIYEPVKQK